MGSDTTRSYPDSGYFVLRARYVVFWMEPDLWVLFEGEWLRCDGIVKAWLWRWQKRRRQRVAGHPYSRVDRDAMVGRLRRRGVNDVDEPAAHHPTLSFYKAVGWMGFPPPGYGTRRLAAGEPTARPANEEWLGDYVTDELVKQAEAGLQGAHQRRDRIEQRAGLLGGGLSISTFLGAIAAAADLGDLKSLSSEEKGLAALGLVFFLMSLAYVVSTIHRTFMEIPSGAGEAIHRRSLQPEEEGRRSYVASLMASRARMAIVASWKLARWQRAVLFQTLGLGCFAVLGVASILCPS